MDTQSCTILDSKKNQIFLKITFENFREIERKILSFIYCTPFGIVGLYFVRLQAQFYEGVGAHWALECNQVTFNASKYNIHIKHFFVLDMLVLWSLLSEYRILLKLKRIFHNCVSKFQNLPTIVKPSLVPRVPWDQSFSNLIDKIDKG